MQHEHARSKWFLLMQQIVTHWYRFVGRRNWQWRFSSDVHNLVLPFLASDIPLRGDYGAHSQKLCTIAILKISWFLAVVDTLKHRLKVSEFNDSHIVNKSSGNCFNLYLSHIWKLHTKNCDMRAPFRNMLLVCIFSFVVSIKTMRSRYHSGVVLCKRKA